MNGKQKKFGIILAIVIAVNILSAWFFFRADLTEEKRYSISKATEGILNNIDDQVVIKVYLDGQALPGGFERLKRAIDQTLEEFKNYAGKQIDYQFIDFNALSEGPARDKLFNELISKGMQPTTIFDKKDGRKTENLIFPYATVWYQNKESVVLLLKGNQAMDAQTKLNQSYENVEFELANAIHKLTLKQKKKIGLLTEFTKLQPVNFAGMINTLQEYYDVFIIDSKASPTFQGLDALIIPKPDFPVDDSTKYKIDQYIMYGGKALFFVDGLKVDSVGLEGTFAQPLDVNLDDLFFNYGVRVNKNMVKDGLNCAVIPLVVGNTGDKPNIQPVPYRYFPLINNFGNSLITRNLDMVYTRFTSDMDTTAERGIQKTPLLMTSPYTKILNAPALVTYNEARTDTDQKEYQGGIKSIAYLLEGKFTSLYKNRMIHSKTAAVPFKAEGESSKIIICSDGDIIVNDVDRKTGEPMALGYDKFTKHTFGNKDFLMNSVSYLVENEGIILAKEKEIKIRLLDTLKTRDERTKWQIINMVLPLGLLLIFGFFRAYLWRKKYNS
jgi:ABC-2 type transport system permease protein